MHCGRGNFVFKHSVVLIDPVAFGMPAVARNISAYVLNVQTMIASRSIVKEGIGVRACGSCSTVSYLVRRRQLLYF